MRAIALSNGMVEVIKEVMQAHQSEKEIQLMGTQLLILTTSSAAPPCNDDDDDNDDLDLPPSIDIIEPKRNQEDDDDDGVVVANGNSNSNSEATIPYTEGGLPPSPSCDLSVPLSPVPAF